MAGAPIGNNNPSKGKRFKSVIEQRLNERAKWDAIVDKAIEQAIDGDKDARNWIADRVDGKAVQSMEIDASVKTHEMSLDELDRERDQDSEASKE